GEDNTTRNMLVSVLLIYLMLPPLLCENLRCFYSPYTTQDTRRLFKVVVTECPPKQLCYKATGRYGNHSALTHHGCMLLKDCNKFKMITVSGAIYNTSYSCCDRAYCNTGSGIAANFATMFVVTGSLSIVMGL
uniref:UPAR/Ly6 domain-containing protein n=1 Tax=Neogobius melanostomus TaxID=47308 RepID=A0A8C6UGH2_9GOBI